jgi:hypothetical protein
MVIDLGAEMTLGDEVDTGTSSLFHWSFAR